MNCGPVYSVYIGEDKSWTYTQSQNWKKKKQDRVSSLYISLYIGKKSNKSGSMLPLYIVEN